MKRSICYLSDRFNYNSLFPQNKQCWAWARQYASAEAQRIPDIFPIDLFLVLLLKKKKQLKNSYKSSVF